MRFSIFLLILSTAGCRTGGTETNTKDIEHIHDIGERPRQVPSQITLIQNLASLPQDEARNFDHVRRAEGKIFDGEGNVIEMGDYWTYYFPSFFNIYGVDWSKHCQQLVENSAGTKIVMFHLAACPADNTLLPAETLRFYTVVDDEQERTIKKGLDGFESRLLRYRGFQVGSLHKKTFDGTVKWYVGDLCDSRGDGGFGDPDETAPKTICNVTKVGDKLLAIRINKNRSGSVRPLFLGGFTLKEGEQELRPYTCVQETASGYACTSHADQMSTGCDNAGLQLLPCRECKRVCEGRFEL